MPAFRRLTPRRHARVIALIVWPGVAALAACSEPASETPDTTNRAATASLAGEPITQRVWAGPAVSPLLRPAFDGRHVAYIDPTTGDVAIHDLIANGDRRLTNVAVEAKPGDFADAPVTGPDGRSVAYAWWSGVEDRYELRITAPGTAVRIVNPPARYAAMMPLAWSRDASRLAVALLDRNGEAALGIVDQNDAISIVPGTARVRGALGTVMFGADRSTLIVDVRQDRARSDSFDIMAIDVETGRTHPVVAHPADDRLGGLTAEGSAVLFFSDRDGTTSLYAQPVMVELQAAGQPIVVARDVWSASGLGTASGAALFYTIQTGVQTLYSAALDPAAATLGAAQPLATVAGGTSEPVAEWIAGGASTLQNFRPTRGQVNGALTIRSLLSGDTRDVATSLASISTLSASPDGSRVLVNGRDRANRIGVYVIDIATGATRAVATASYDAPAMVRGAGWSNVSREAYFTVEEFRRDRVRLVARDVTGGRERTLLDLPCTLRCGGRVSPDGRLFAMVQPMAPPSSGLRVLTVPTAGGAPREIAEIPASQSVTSAPAWTPDGRAVVIATSGGGRRNTASLLVAHVTERGSVLSALPVAGPASSVRVHPDGRHILFIAGESAFEMWRADSLRLPLSR